MSSKENFRALKMFQANFFSSELFLALSELYESDSESSCEHFGTKVSLDVIIEPN